MIGVKKKQVTTSTLVKRINRQLAKRGRFGEVLKKTRGVQAYLDLGDRWILDLETGMIEDRNVDLSELGRELGVLRDNEVLIEN